MGSAGHSNPPQARAVAADVMQREAATGAPALHTAQMVGTTGAGRSDPGRGRGRGREGGRGDIINHTGRGIQHRASYMESPPVAAGAHPLTAHTAFPALADQSLASAAPSIATAWGPRATDAPHAPQPQLFQLSTRAFPELVSAAHSHHSGASAHHRYIFTLDSYKMGLLILLSQIQTE